MQSVNHPTDDLQGTQVSRLTKLHCSTLFQQFSITCYFPHYTVVLHIFIAKLRKILYQKMSISHLFLLQKNIPSEQQIKIKDNSSRLPVCKRIHMR